MKMLLGIYGKDALKYQDCIDNNVNQYKVINRNFLISNINAGRVKYPSSVSNNSKSLFLNGLPILKKYTLDEFMNNPSTILHSILRENIIDIPKEFVNGAYNGVILENDNIYFFNDFFALQPLYYSIKDETLFFSTNLQLLSKILKPDWNQDAIIEYLQLGCNFNYETILKDIYCLPPASILRYKDGNIILKNYAYFPENREVNASQEEVIEEIYLKFQKSIERIYSSKLEYSLSLTGGMDSRLVFLEWPDKQNLLTETAGENTSDYFKAKELVERLGNPNLYELEDLKDDLYFEGIKKYYDLCDNPTKLMADYNYYHILWKQNRRADIHLSGVGGELLDGENLYLSRKPFYILKEGILPYSYHELGFNSSADLIKNVLYSEYKRNISGIIDENFTTNKSPFEEIIAGKLDTYLGNPFYKETYIERFRTLMLSNSAYYPLSFVSQMNDFPISPFNDRELIQAISKYHPATRELRRLSFSILRKYEEAQDIPLDTTHINPFYPYPIHKFFRVLRMVLNIGLHKKVPFIQKGKPPRFRAFKYFDYSMTDYREYVNTTIQECSFYNCNRVQRYLNKIEKVSGFNFYTHHNEAANISILFRLAIAEKKLKH